MEMLIYRNVLVVCELTGHSTSLLKTGIVKGDVAKTDDAEEIRRIIEGMIN
jgi:hypothetical protein